MRLRALAFLMLAAAPVMAEPHKSSLGWVRLTGAESCITPIELASRVETHLGHRVFDDPSQADVAIEGHVERGADRHFHVSITGSRRDRTLIGKRELISEGTECRALDDSLALVIALMIDPDAPLSGEAPRKQEAPPPPREIIIHEREVIHDRAPEPIERPRTPILASVTLAGALQVARLASVSGGVQLGVEFGVSALSTFALTLSATPSVSIGVTGGSLQTSLIEGGFGWLPSVRISEFVELGANLSLRVGSLSSQGSGFSSSKSVSNMSADLLLGPRAVIFIAGPVFLVGSISAAIPFVQQHWTATDAGGQSIILRERSALGGEATLGLGFRFSR